MAIARRARRPEAEGAVYVDPRAPLVSTRADVSGGIEGSGVHVARLNADDRAVVERRQRVGTHATLSVDRHAMDTLAAEPKQPQRFQQRDMDLAADNDSERRRTKQPVAFDVPSGAL